MSSSRFHPCVSGRNGPVIAGVSASPDTSPGQRSIPRAVVPDPIVWIVSILVLASACEAATVSSSVVYVTRNRRTATFEEYSIRISVTYQVSDLTLGAVSHAIIQGPGGEAVSLSVGSVRGGQLSFSATLPLASLAAARGAWSVTINEGVQAHEDVDILVPILNESNFASYPSFPVPFYLGDSFKVFAPLVANGATGSAGATGYSSSSLVTNGIIYTFPAGGPFRVMADRSFSLPSVAIQTAGGQFLKWVEFTSAKSESEIRIHTGPVPHPFAGRCEVTAGRALFEASGLEPGQSYTLWRSSGLSMWAPIYTFTAPSNVHQHQEDSSGSGVFFRLGKNE